MFCYNHIERGGGKTKQLRVIIATPPPGPSGGIQYYYDVIRRRFNVEVDYAYRGSLQSESSMLCTVLRLLDGYAAFTKLLLRNNYDIVHINTSLGHKGVLRDSVYILIGKLFLKKIVVFVRGWDPDFNTNVSPIIFSIFKRLYFGADCLIVLGHKIKETMEGWGCKHRIFVETTIVDDGLLRGFDIEAKLVSLSKYHCTNILFLARVEKDKGIYEAIDAFELLSLTNKNIKLNIAGNGSELVNAKLYAETKKLTRIFFLGYVREQDKIDAFKTADIYILPSYHEGMPNSLLEAMAFGLPVITRPVGGIVDFFENGKMGFMTESRSPEVFANLIEKLISDTELRNKMALYNFQFARKRFLASEVVKRLEKIYQDTLDAR